MAIDLDSLATAIPLAPAHLEAVQRVAIARPLAAGEPLLREGDRSSQLAIVCDGELAVAVDDGHVVGRLGPGALVGEVSLLDDGPASATVSATRSSTVWLLDRAILDALYRDEPRAAAALMRAVCGTLAARIRSSTDLLAGESAPTKRSLFAVLRSLFGAKETA